MRIKIHNFVLIMKDEGKNNKLIVKSLSKMIADKGAVRSYLRGEISIKSLNKKGIKFAKPL